MDSSAAWTATTATGIAAMTGTVTIGMADRAGTGAAPSGSSRAASRSVETWQKPLDSGGFFAFSAAGHGRENSAGLLDIGESLC